MPDSGAEAETEQFITNGTAGDSKDWKLILGQTPSYKINPRVPADSKDISASADTTIGKLNFSSSGNDKYFGAFENETCDGAVGDGFGSAVMLLVEPLPSSWSLDKVLDFFGISGSSPASDKSPDFVKTLTDCLKGITTIQLNKTHVASPDVPNAVWFSTAKDGGYSSRLSLNYDFQLDQNAVSGWAKAEPALPFDLQSASKGVTLTLNQHAAYALSGNQVTPTKTNTVSICILFDDCHIYLNAEKSEKESTKSLYLIPTGSTDWPSTLSVFGITSDDVHLDDLGKFSDFLGPRTLQYAQVEPAADANSKPSYRIVWLTPLSLKGVTSPHIKFSLVYETKTDDGKDDKPAGGAEAPGEADESKTFTGSLLFKDDYPGVPELRAIDFDPYTSLKAGDKDAAPENLSLQDIFPDIGASPIPLTITKAVVGVGKKGKYQNFSLDATLVNLSSTSTDSESTIPFPFTWDEGSVALTQSTDPDEGLKVAVAAKFSLHPNSTVAKDDPTFKVNVNYSRKLTTEDAKSSSGTDPPSKPGQTPESNTPLKTDASLQTDAPSNTDATTKTDPPKPYWSLDAEVENLSVGALRQIFGDDSNAANELLGGLTISGKILYVFDKGEASSFLIVGKISLGDLEFDLSFYSSNSSSKPSPEDPPSAIDWYNAEKTPNSSESEVGQQTKPTTRMTTGRVTKLALENVKESSPSNGEPATPDDKKYDFTFEADIKTKQNSTIGSLFDSFHPPPDPSIVPPPPPPSSGLPDFVSSIPINLEPSDVPTAMFRFACKDGDDNTRHSILTCFISIAGLTLTYVQMKTSPKPAAKATPNAIPADSTATPVKRLLRISVDQIPMMNRIPIVGTMPQPFDHLEYVWVSDSSFDQAVQVNAKAKPDRTMFGFTAEELAQISEINENTETAIPPFQTKQSDSQVTPKKDDASAGSDKTPGANTDAAKATALCAGHHFIVVTNGKVVLDHVFDTNSKDSQGDKSEQTSGTADNKPADVKSTPLLKDTASESTSAAVEEAPPTKGATKTSAGGLSIDALTFQYKSGSLVVSIDATLTLGPIKLSVVGFTISIDLSKVKLNHLSDIVTEGLVHIALHGMEVGYQSGPLTLKGVFVHDESDAGESYRGGIAVGFKVWQVLAVGEYFIATEEVKDAAGNPVKDKDGNIETRETYRSIFVYGKLDGPLIELEFATISGVRLGFGHNYSIRMPSVNELYSFPLISDAGASESGNDPMTVLTAFLGNPKADPAVPGFVTQEMGSQWFAAGMTITAFDVLKLTAVLVMDIDTGAVNPDDKGVIIALFADGVFQMEPEAPPEASLFYIELLVKVEFNFVHGYIAAEAALAPPSHIYVPFAHLTGSAAFYSWFGNNPHAGDWVVTIGGYARSYTPPAWYPRTDRISISFTVGDCIQVIGQAYMATTPQCAMGGGSLHISLCVGPVSAYADLIFDAFINFKPFHFRAEMSIDVGVECDIDFWFVHIHVSVSIGADMIVWGPHDFGGNAHVDFWFFGFDIAFGAAEFTPGPSTLEEFYDMVICPGPSSTKPTDDTIGSPGSKTTVALHKYSIEAGIAVTKAPAASPNSQFPSTGATSKWSVQAGALVFRIDCSFALSEAQYAQKDIQLAEGSTTPDDFYSFPMHIDTKNAITSVATVTITRHDVANNAFKPSMVVKSAAPALWRKWDPDFNPLDTDPAKNPKSMMLVTALRFEAPDPVLCLSDIIPFDATATMKRLIDVEPVPYIPKPEAQDEKLFAPAYIGPPALDSTTTPPASADNQKPRWTAFKKLWSDDAHDQTRGEVLDGIAAALEWAIRPPAQQPGNDPTTNVDSSLDWKLCADRPKMLIDNTDNEFNALPWTVVGAA